MKHTVRLTKKDSDPDEDYIAELELSVIPMKGDVLLIHHQKSDITTYEVISRQFTIQVDDDDVDKMTVVLEVEESRATKQNQGALPV